MTDKIVVHSRTSSRIAIIASVMVVLLCCGEFVRIELMLKEQIKRTIQLELVLIERIELMLKEQNTRMNALEDKMTSTVNTNMNVVNSVDNHRILKQNEEQQPDSQETSRRILKRKIRQTSMEVNQTKAMERDELQKIIYQEVGKAVSTLQAAKYWIAIPGPPGKRGVKGNRGVRGSMGKPGDKGNRGVRGPMGKPGHKGNRGVRGPMAKPARRGKRGPRGFKGDPGKNGAPGPRGMPGLKGNPGPSLASPSVVISPPHLTVDEGQSATLHCSVSGYPKPVVVWKKTNSLLANKRAVIDSSGRLDINHVTPDDSGTYQCKASNILGKSQNIATLEVNFRPRLILKTDPIYKKTGDDITLPECHATGHPKPNITWSKAIGSLPNGRTVIKDGQLTLLKSKKDDSGTYVCKADNRLGSAVSVIVVNAFIQLPVFVIKPPSTYTVSPGTTVVLNCTANGDPQPVISWRKENDVLPAGRSEVRDGSLIIRNSKRTDSGVFVCTATSAGVFEVDTKTTLNIRSDAKYCSDIWKSGERRNGIYTVKPDDQGAFQVYCDMITDGGGWTVFQRRKDGSVDFYRDWQQYKTGFGDLNGEFWLGNDYIHRLTARTASSLRVDLEDWGGTSIYAKYGSFSVGDESDKYRLSVGSYSGNAGDSLALHNNMAFSTKDRDNDKYSGNCAAYNTGAWWYKTCYESNLNGQYLENKDDTKGISWYSYKKNFLSMKTSAMKLRPQSF